MNQYIKKMMLAELSQKENFLKLYIKPKPKLMPKFIYQWLLSWIIVEEHRLHL